MMLSLMAAALLAPPPLALQERWKAPQDLPIARVHGYFEVGKQRYLAGIEGLYRKEAQWERIDERPVREMMLSNAVWVLYGDGSVDKLDHQEGRLYFDVMAGAAKRPWVSCLGPIGDGVGFGGNGGWMVRGPARAPKLSEFYPPELKGDVVTAISGGIGPRGITTYVGTQKHGLFEFSKGNVKRYGFAAGLPDSWVTALSPGRGQLVVALADGGLVRIGKAGKVEPMPQPETRVRKLMSFRDGLVVGGMSGCWFGWGTSWQKLTEEETTGLAYRDGFQSLGVCTPTGITWWK